MVLDLYALKLSSAAGLPNEGPLALRPLITQGLLLSDYF